MGDYTEHLISMAGGDGDDALDLNAIQAQAEINKYLGRTASQDEAKNTLALLALVREQAEQIERVRELHTFAHTDVEPWAAGYRYSGDHCGFDGEHWPCATVAALTATDQP